MIDKELLIVELNRMTDTLTAFKKLLEDGKISEDGKTTMSYIRCISLSDLFDSIIKIINKIKRDELGE